MQTVKNDTNTFYDAIADQYHLFYRDWEATMQREGSMLRRAFRDRNVKTVLDASCGTGTQAIALARQDFDVTAADPSFNMMQKARQLAGEHGVADDITFVRAGFLELTHSLVGPYDAVITKGNALPHLITDGEITQALSNFYKLLRPGGTVLIGMRDFDFMLEDRPRFVPRHAHLEDDPNEENILFDIWDWHDGDPVTVTFNTFIVTGKDDEYRAAKYPVTYRALRREELETMMAKVGFVNLKGETQAWELVITATKPG